MKVQTTPPTEKTLPGSESPRAVSETHVKKKWKQR